MSHAAMERFGAGESVSERVNESVSIETHKHTFLERQRRARMKAESETERDNRRLFYALTIRTVADEIWNRTKKVPKRSL